MEPTTLTLPDLHQIFRHSVFRYCTKDDLNTMAASDNCFSYKKGERIFEIDTFSAHLYCVFEGVIKVHRPAPGAKEFITRMAHTGDLLGFITVLSDTPYPVSATAVTDATLCAIPKQKLIHIYKSNPTFCREYTSMLCTEIEAITQRAADIAYKPVMGRIAEALLFLSEIYKGPKNPNGDIELRREDLADFVGTVKETAIRTLRKFKEENIIAINRRNIQVKDRTSLAKIVKLYE